MTREEHRPSGSDGYDHTAPYRCSKPGCETCKAKPVYNDWAREVALRGTERQ